MCKEEQTNCIWISIIISIDAITFVIFFWKNVKEFLAQYLCDTDKKKRGSNPVEAEKRARLAAKEAAEPLLMQNNPR